MQNHTTLNAALLDAADRDDLDGMRAALAGGADPNAAHSDSNRLYTSLHHAASKGSREAVALLVESGGALDSVDKYGFLPLECAIRFYRAPDSEAFCIWLAKLSPSSLVKSERAVVMAAENNFVCLIDALVEAGCTVASRGGSDRLPLAAAARAGALEAVIKVLDLGVHVDGVGEHDYTPLHKAAAQGHVDVVRYLLAAGADPNSAQVAQYRPLHSIASRDTGELVDMLLQAGADLHAENKYGETALDYAIKSGATKVMVALEAAGASGPVSQEQLDARLAAAAKAGQAPMVRHLLGRGADPTCRPRGKTLLQYAKSDAVEVKQLILAARSGTLISDVVGESPRTTATCRRCDESAL